eukprot:scaffold49439_cov35-Tisochrysis_lutea.AAC.1
MATGATCLLVRLIVSLGARLFASERRTSTSGRRYLPTTRGPYCASLTPSLRSGAHRCLQWGLSVLAQ